MTEQEFEKTVEQFCDGYCKFPYVCKDEERLHSVCDCCPIVKLVEENERCRDVKQQKQKTCRKAL